MLYSSHPLESKDVNVILSAGLISRPTKTPRVPVALDTVHHLDECRECHLYVKHLDKCFTNDLFTHPAHDSTPEAIGGYLTGFKHGRRIQLQEDDMSFSRYRSRLHAVEKRVHGLIAEREQLNRVINLLEGDVMTLQDQLLATKIAYGAESDDSIGFNSTRRPPYLSGMPTTDPLEEEWSDDFATDTSSSDDEDEFSLEQQLHFMGNGERTRQIHAASDSESDDCESLSSESSLSRPETPASDPDDDILAKNGTSLTSPPLEPELSIDELTTLLQAAQENGNNEALSEVRLLVQDAQRTPRRKRTAAQLYLLLVWRIPTWVSNASPPPTGTQGLQPSLSVASTVPEVFVDASGWGIGLTIDDHWLAWKFKALAQHAAPVDHRGNVIMSWAELIALELGVLTVITAGYRNTKVLLRSDNEGVVDAVKRRTWTARHGLQEILDRILLHCQSAGLGLDVQWVPTKQNPADKPSRGVFPPQRLMFPHSPALPTNLGLILREIDAHQAARN